jgi:hypothetical protein
MIIAFTGVSFHGSAPSYPPAGTFITAVCASQSDPGVASQVYYDANGTLFTGGFDLWEQYHDGSGGSYWTSFGTGATNGANACYLPYGFYTNNNSGFHYTNWTACGSTGSFGPTGEYYDYSYSSGNGGFESDSGNQYFNPPANGDLIYDGGCCQVYYDGNNGYYTNDNCGCPDPGLYMGLACISTGGDDARGVHFDGAWQWGEQYTDGSCGSYVNYIGTNGEGCYYPSGWYHSYDTSDNGSNTWYVEDSDANQMASGTYQYSYSWSAYIADGYGSSDQSIGTVYSSYGDFFADGTYYDSALAQGWYYAIYSDGGFGYYVLKYPI